MKRIEYFISVPEAERIFGKEKNLSAYEFCGYYRLIQTACGYTSKYPDNSLSIKEIEDFLNLLGENRKRCIRLRFWDCLTLKEIGKIMSTSSENARQIQEKVLIKVYKRFSFEVVKDALQVKETLASLAARGKLCECELPIENLGLSERCLNILLRAGLDTIGKVIVKTDKELLQVRNFGPVYMTELDDKLQSSFGLTRGSSIFSNIEELRVQLQDLISKNKQHEFKASVNILNFSSRTCNVLKRAKIYTIGELLSRSDEELLKERFLGTACLNEIDEKLNQYFSVERHKENYENIRKKFAEFLLAGRQNEFDEPIERLSLSVRPYGVLKRNGVDTIGQLLSKDEKQLLRFKKMGLVSVKEIRTKIYEVLNYICFD